MTKPHFGVMVPQIKRTWEQSAAAASTFEELGFDSIWVNDHLYGPASPQIPMLEAWTLIAALAAKTERVEIGTLVTPAGMRNPQHLGKTIATVDHIAGGRVIAGLGSGWMRAEYEDFGMPFLEGPARARQLKETVSLLKQMWTSSEPVTMQGEFVSATNLVTEPKPPREVPILIGGTGKQVTLPLAAREASIWNNPAGSQGRLEENVEALRAAMEKVQRDPSEVRISQQCLVAIAPNEAEAGPMIETAKRIFAGHMGDPTGPLAITGTPERVVEQIGKHIDLGCSMFMIEFFGTDTRVPAQLFAETVLPHFERD
jgi:alkanesulfonate monooxygenase SsuD/methylene tetrahydromethanopterin reductase-like flavin-dependent oxidoreductase (luciferase family)